MFGFPSSLSTAAAAAAAGGGGGGGGGLQSRCPNTLEELTTMFPNDQEPKDRVEIETCLNRFGNDSEQRKYVIDRIHSNSIY